VAGQRLEEPGWGVKAQPPADAHLPVHPRRPGGAVLRPGQRPADANRDLERDQRCPESPGCRRGQSCRGRGTDPNLHVVGVVLRVRPLHRRGAGRRHHDRAHHHWRLDGDELVAALGYWRRRAMTLPRGRRRARQASLSSLAAVLEFGGQRLSLDELTFDLHVDNDRDFPGNRPCCPRSCCVRRSPCCPDRRGPASWKEFNADLGTSRIVVVLAAP
jgi:hypothetical protein